MEHGAAEIAGSKRQRRERCESKRENKNKEQTLVGSETQVNLGRV